MKMKIKYLALLLAVSALIGLTLAQAATWQTISNVMQGQTVATPSQPLIVSPDPMNAAAGGPGLKATSVGVPDELWLDVDNPNAEAVYGWLMINFTSNIGIGSNDVTLISQSPYSPSIINMGIYNDALVFRVQINGANPLFRFDPGFRSNYTCLVIQYNVPANYNWALAICQ